MSCPTVDQASKQNIGDSEFVNLVVRWHDQDIWPELYGFSFKN